MHIRWNRRQLKSNQHRGVLVCPHIDIKRPWVRHPYLMHLYPEDTSAKVIWSPGPSIRDCCIERQEGHALAAWWWGVSQRMQDVVTKGLEDPEITKAIIEQFDLIEEYLEEVVPKPSQQSMDKYLEFREDIGLESRSGYQKRLPGFVRTLGISWPCTKEALEKHWRKLALQYHPDRPTGDSFKFRQCNEAYLQAKAYFGE